MRTITKVGLGMLLASAVVLGTCNNKAKFDDATKNTQSPNPLPTELKTNEGVNNLTKATKDWEKATRFYEGAASVNKAFFKLV